MKNLIEKNITSTKEKKWPQYFGSISNSLNTLENNLCNNLAKKGGLLSSILSHIFQAGGKRLRPALGFLIAKGTGEITEKQIILGELTELIHTASLIHDDIIDSANYRRGKETINNLWNDKISVISGDFLFAQASVRLGLLENTEIVKIYANVLSDLCEGEIDQFARKYDTNIDWDYYISKSKAKTASLFAAVCKSAAMLNELDNETIKKANDFGNNLGISFQIVDDILDFTSNQKDLGKDVCGDLKQGLITAPTLYALEESSDKSERLRKLINGRFTNSENDFNEAIKIVHELKGVKKAELLARDYMEKAKENLSIIDNEIIKNDLELLTHAVFNKLEKKS